MTLTPDQFAENLTSAADELRDQLLFDLSAASQDLVTRSRQRARQLYRIRTGKMVQSIVDLEPRVAGDDLEAGAAIDTSVASYTPVHEGTGKVTIRPKKGRYLRIPLTDDARDERYDRSRYWILDRPGRNPLIMPRDGGPPRFVLAEQVTIQQHPFISDPLEEVARELVLNIGSSVETAVEGG